MRSFCSWDPNEIARLFNFTEVLDANLFGAEYYAVGKIEFERYVDLFYKLTLHESTSFYVNGDLVGFSGN